MGREIGGDVAGADVRLVADLGVTDVGEMRNLRPFAEARVLDLDERSRLRVSAEHSAGAKVTEGADQRTEADRGVPGDDMRSDLGAAGDRRRASENGEGMDDDVGLELDTGVDPGRRRIHDRGTREHVPLVDPVPESRSRHRELDAVVDAEGRQWIR